MTKDETTPAPSVSRPSHGYKKDFGIWIHDFDTDRWYAFDQRDPQKPRLLTGPDAHAFRKAMDAVVAKMLGPLHLDD